MKAKFTADDLLFEGGEYMLKLRTKLALWGVSACQLYLLCQLSKESSNMTEIARMMGHTTAAATGLVDRLESMAYVERIHSPEDRRVVLVHITSTGLNLVSKSRTALQGHINAPKEQKQQKVAA
ncbi:MAG: MarR family transcriptional regulator [Patescibacteria group bacterium]